MASAGKVRKQVSECLENIAQFLMRFYGYELRITQCHYGHICIYHFHALE